MQATTSAGDDARTRSVGRVAQQVSVTFDLSHAAACERDYHSNDRDPAVASTAPQVLDDSAVLY